MQLTQHVRSWLTQLNAEVLRLTADPVVTSDAMSAVTDELDELCTIMMQPLQMMLKQCWLKKRRDALAKAELDAQSPSYTPIDDDGYATPPDEALTLPVAEACDALPTNDDAATTTSTTKPPVPAVIPFPCGGPPSSSTTIIPPWRLSRPNRVIAPRPRRVVPPPSSVSVPLQSGNHAALPCHLGVVLGHRQPTLLPSTTVVRPPLAPHPMSVVTPRSCRCAMPPQPPVKRQRIMPPPPPPAQPSF